MLRAYLAGPDVFLSNAVAHARAKVEICARHGIQGLPPLNEDLESLALMPEAEAWRTIYLKDLAMMESADIIIANLTPFRGASADAGTLIEVGWFLGQGRKVFGYSNSAILFSARSTIQTKALPDAVSGMTVEGFGLPDNLMIAGAVLFGGSLPLMHPRDGLDRPFDSLEIFELIVEDVARNLGS